MKNDTRNVLGKCYKASSRELLSLPCGRLLAIINNNKIFSSIEKQLYPC